MPFTDDHIARLEHLAEEAYMMAISDLPTKRGTISELWDILPRHLPNTLSQRELLVIGGKIVHICEVYARPVGEAA